MSLFTRPAWRRLKKDDRGATAVEYGLLAALIAVVLIAALTSIGTTLSGTFNTIATRLSSASAGN